MEAASTVCGFEIRDGYILAIIESQKAVTSYSRKKDVMKMFS